MNNGKITMYIESVLGVRCAVSAAVTTGQVIGDRRRRSIFPVSGRGPDRQSSFWTLYAEQMFRVCDHVSFAPSQPALFGGKRLRLRSC